MGVAVVEDAAGNRQILVSTSEPNGYLRPGVNLNDGEVLVRGPRGSHAEADIVRYAEENGLTVVDIGATRPVCANCQSVIPDDTNITTPLK
jgi:filamentous hemagglutinin